MKKAFLFVSLLALAQCAFAADYMDVAPVVSVTPIHQEISVPQQYCTSQPVTTAMQGSPSYAGPIIGGVTGGLLGSLIGHGNGRVVATAGGAIVGSITGANLQRASYTTQTTMQQQCMTQSSVRDSIVGYTVVYQYGGRNITTQLPYDPGRQVRIGVGAM